MTEPAPTDAAAQAASVSVIVVSRGRPAMLLRCLTGLGQLLYPQYEIVVVADPEALAAVAAAGWTGRLRTVACDEPNISLARNLGIAQAAGEVVAFIDDDSVPEPTWLSWLVLPFSDPVVAATGGFVRGRNGISWQWQGRYAGPDGVSHPLAVDPAHPTVLHAVPGLAVRTEGTNMAFRRDLLAGMGGFDPAFRFYLDETDLNLRLADRRLATALVPRAEVHHGFAASASRRADRVPRDLHEIGASLAVFLRKHGAEVDHALCWRNERAVQRQRLVGHMVAGRLEPRDVDRLLAGLDAGRAEGQSRPLVPPVPIAASAAPFHPFRRQMPYRGHRVLAGWRWQRAARTAEAEAAISAGHHATVHTFAISGGYHRVGYSKKGFWFQSGGLFGRSLRSDPLWCFWRFGARLKRESSRVAAVRAEADPVLVQAMPEGAGMVPVGGTKGR